MKIMIKKQVTEKHRWRSCFWEYLTNHDVNFILRICEGTLVMSCRKDVKLGSSVLAHAHISIIGLAVNCVS